MLFMDDPRSNVFRGYPSRHPRWPGQRLIERDGLLWLAFTISHAEVLANLWGSLVAGVDQRTCADVIGYRS